MSSVAPEQIRKNFLITLSMFGPIRLSVTAVWGKTCKRLPVNFHKSRFIDADEARNARTLEDRLRLRFLGRRFPLVPRLVRIVVQLAVDETEPIGGRRALIEV